MIILFKCECMKTEAGVHVPDRIPASPLGDWLFIMETCLTYDHRNRYPRCKAQKMEYVKIPHDESSTQLGTPHIRN